MDRSWLKISSVPLPLFVLPKMISMCFLLLSTPLHSNAIALPTSTSVSSSPDSHSTALGMTSTSSASTITAATALKNGTPTRTVLSTTTIHQDDKDRVQTDTRNPVLQTTLFSSPTVSLSLSTRALANIEEDDNNSSTHDQDEDYQNDQFHSYQQQHHQDHEQHDVPGRDNCVLPDSWKGKWFQSGVSPPFMIDNKSMGEKGSCIERSGDKFLFVASEKSQDCFRCIVINERHKNVLQYKESSYCEEKNSLENLCSQIPGDAQLYSLFRVDAQPEDCPFKGAPFTFTYNRGHGECKNPVSFVDTCTESSKLLLRYQACPDVQKTESAAEELQCLAQWKEGSHHYLVGKLTRERTIIPSNEESYRCFIYEKTKSGAGSPGGYTVAMSGDATCTGIFSSTEGARTLTFSKAEKTEGRCTFPQWLTSHHWHTLDGKMSVKIHHKNSTMHITEDSRRNSSVQAVGINIRGSSGESFGANNNRIASLFAGGTRIVCQTKHDIQEGKHVAIVAKRTQGCKSEQICMHIYQRTNHVIEIQMLRHSDHHGEDFDCSKANALGQNSPYVTLVNPEAKSNRCPNLGRYMATGVSADGRVVRDACGSTTQGGFHTLVVGCDDRATMEFHSKCATHNSISSYECHGSWEENGNGFLIALPLSRSSTSARRYCFIYQETDEGISVVSSSESCRRNVGPEIEGVWAFNLTVDGQCAQAVTGSGTGSLLKACDILLASLIASILVVRFNQFLGFARNSQTLSSSQPSLTEVPLEEFSNSMHTKISPKRESMVSLSSNTSKRTNERRLILVCR